MYHHPGELCLKKQTQKNSFIIMIANILIATRSSNKVQGEFYPLSKQELIILQRNKLINNTTFLHLALCTKNYLVGEK